MNKEFTLSKLHKKHTGKSKVNSFIHTAQGVDPTGKSRELGTTEKKMKRKVQNSKTDLERGNGSNVSQSNLI